MEESRRKALETMRKNGKSPGRKPGKASQKTLDKARTLRKVEDIYLTKAREIARASLHIALGQVFVYRVDTEYGPKGAVISRKHTLVTSAKEIERALDQIGMMGESTGERKDEYYYVTTKEPNASAIKDIFDRTFGKAREPSVDDASDKLVGVFKRIYGRSKEL